MTDYTPTTESVTIMPELVGEKTLVARKGHRCMLCGDWAVRKGETYSRRTWRHDGRLYNWIECTQCAVVIARCREGGYMDDDGGVDATLADEWARDFYYEQVAAEYLVRRGYVLAEVVRDAPAR